MMKGFSSIHASRLSFTFPALSLLAVALFVTACAGFPRQTAVSNSSYIRAGLGQAELAIVNRYRQSIPQQMLDQNVPGLALAVVDEAGILWKEGFGCTDRDCAKPVTPDTLFSVQSTSKTVTATALMFAIQDGLVDFDTPVSKFLPNFHVKSVFEERPEDKITLRHLLSHTAGFTHDPPYGNNNDLGPYSFEQHIESISDTWLGFPVGSAYYYSNIGPDLAAYILQVRAGKPFYQYVQERMLAPLGMTRSSYDQQQVRRDSDRAIGHTWPFASAPFDMPFVGAGGFFTSASEMAAFIRFQINRGVVDGRQLLDAKLLDTMYSYHFDSAARVDAYGLGIAHNSIDNIPVLLHGGGGVGFLCDMYWFPDLKLGIILLTNSTDHGLQRQTAPQILGDLARTPKTVYNERLASLQGHFPSLDHLDANLRVSRSTRDVSSLAFSPSQSDKQRWASYAGLYRLKTWNAVVASWPFVEKGDHMYLNGIQMEELRPGVFFTAEGQAFDLTGAEPVAWDGIEIDKAKNDLTPVKEGIMASCGIALLSALLVPLGIWLASRLRRRSPSSQISADRRLRLVAVVVSSLTALAGLIFLGAVIMLPPVLYQDAFALNVNLGPDLRLIMSLPFVLGISAVSLVALCIATWTRRVWSMPRRLHYVAVTVAALTLSLMLFGWNVVSFGF